MKLPSLSPGDDESDDEWPGDWVPAKRDDD